jgi:hypothetical protein
VLWGHAVRNARSRRSPRSRSGSASSWAGDHDRTGLLYPGLGLRTINARLQDFRLLQGLFFFASVAILVSNLPPTCCTAGSTRVKEA